MAGFAEQIKAWRGKVEKRADAFVRHVSLGTLSDVVMMSPVGNPDLWKENAGQAYKRDTYNLFVAAMNTDAAQTGGKQTRRASPKRLQKMFPNKAGAGYVGGRFRGNWQVGVNVRPQGELERIDASGSATIADGSSAISGARAGDMIWLSNNLPYALRLEFGHSKQAPGGMVRITAATWQAKIDEALRAAKAETP